MTTTATDKKLKTFYVTFGQKYRYERHPHTIGSVYPHPDGWFEIRRFTWDEASEVAMRAFDGKFATLYSEATWEPHWFRLGKLGELE
jgi:O-phosphoseryl-tRNA(Cys) synthetase